MLILQANIKHTHRLMRKVGKCGKYVLLMQSKQKTLKTVLKKCTCVQYDRNQIGENSASPLENERTSSASCFDK